MRTDLPAGAIRRLTEHYGPSVLPWLDQLTATLSTAAERWRVKLCGYHDAGWTSVVALGRRADGHRVIIKALPDVERYTHERVALAHWREAPVNRVLDTDDTNQLLLLEVVAGVPGGNPRPIDHQRRVAASLSRLHGATALVASPVPLLTEYYIGTVVPRVERRADRFGDLVGAGHVALCVKVAHELCGRSTRRRMLHSDLYAENVLFDADGEPVFVDPHAKIGSPAFDWAFWCVYYVPTSGFEDRVSLCSEGGVPLAV